MITSHIESILFASGKPVSVATLKKTLDLSDEVLNEALEEMRGRFNREDSGIHILAHEGKVQFVTNPANSELVSSLLKQELTGDLTRPQLETLTIIAYRGPITKPEIEQIRGINCSLILRNLAMRGLVDEAEDAQKLQPVFTVSADLVRHLGLHALTELPEYESLHTHEKLNEMLGESPAPVPEPDAKPESV